MNHLAHFKLAFEEPALVVGTFLGDQVKGRLTGQFHPHIEFGIQLHRKIDSYTDTHPIVKHSYRRLAPEFRRYCPILMDIFYDHILAKNWQEFHHQPLQAFNDWIFSTLEDWQGEMPDTSTSMARRMKESRILLLYADADVIPGILARVSSRLKRDNPIAEAYGPFVANLPGLEEDFRSFFPQLSTLIEDTISDHGSFTR